MYVLLFCFFFVLYWDRVLLCSTVYPRTCYIDQADLELRVLHTSASQAWALKACATIQTTFETSNPLKHFVFGAGDQTQIISHCYVAGLYPSLLPTSFLEHVICLEKSLSLREGVRGCTTVVLVIAFWVPVYVALGVSLKLTFTALKLKHCRKVTAGLAFGSLAQWISAP